MDNFMTWWCKSETGVSPILFNIYVRELGIKVAQRREGFK